MIACEPADNEDVTGFGGREGIGGSIGGRV